MAHVIPSPMIEHARRMADIFYGSPHFLPASRWVLVSKNGSDSSMWGPTRHYLVSGPSGSVGTYPKGARSQIMGFEGPNTTILMVFGP